MTWDINVPSGYDLKSDLGSALRSMKADLESAFAAEHQFPNSGNMIHKIPMTDVAGHDGRIRYYNSRLEAYLNGAWQTAGGFPIGTRTIFWSSSAPTGWARVASVSNDVLLRTRGSGNVANGGAWGVTTGAASASHDHGGATTGGGVEWGTLQHSFSTIKKTGSASSSYVTSIANHDGSHEHVIVPDIQAVPGNPQHVHTVPSSWRPLYFDVIVCSKE